MVDKKRRCEEVELKLFGKPAGLAAAFRTLADDEPDVRRVVSTYYDTGDRKLWRKGFTLRLRGVDQGYELTLKRRSGDPLRRGEWTVVIGGPSVDLALLPGSARLDDIATILPEQFEVCFETDINRAKQCVEFEGAVVEVALDCGKIRAAGREMDVAELELELLDGPVLAMLWLARGLTNRRRLTLGARSKAERGMALPGDLPPAPARAGKPRLKRSDPIARALSRILKVTAAQMIGNLPAAADGRDPEGVHQLRVSLRRLGTAWTLFAAHLSPRARPLEAETARVLKVLGPARDLDVFITQMLPPVLEGAARREGLVRLAELARLGRREACQSVCDLIHAPQFTRFALDLLITAEDVEALVIEGEGRVDRLAGRLLQKRHKKVIRLGRDFANLPFEKRHRVRIALKKLRYACDFFQTLYPGKATRNYVKRLVRLQDELGQLNDARMIGEIAGGLAGDDAEARLGAALAMGWYQHRLLAGEPRMIAAWRDFAGEPVFWRR